MANLAGVPSIVFGLFGLGFFVQFLGAGIDKAFFHGEKVFGQPALIWAALTMAVLTLPVVIVATEEALRAVPRELREASLALGATKFQTVMHVVRAAGERRHPHRHHPGVSAAAPARWRPSCSPGAAYFLPQLPKRLSSQFMSPSYHVYVLATQSPDVDATKPILYATVLVLLALTFTLNIAAVIVRARGFGAARGCSAERHTPPACRRPTRTPKLVVRDLTVFYGEKKAVGPVAMDIVGQHVTALIGPSGCGKSTFLRSLNRMNELIPGCRDRRARSSWTASRSTAAGIDPGGGAAPHRDGVPALEPLPQVDLRERRLRPAHRRHQGRPRHRRARRAGAARRPPSGTR